MTGVEKENAVAENGCDNVDPLLSSPLLSSSRRRQISRPIYSSSPGAERMMTTGEAAGGLGWNGHENAGRWTTWIGVGPEGGGRVGSRNLGRDKDHDPLILACLTPLSPALPPLAGGGGPGRALPSPSPAFWDYHCT